MNNRQIRSNGDAPIGNGQPQPPINQGRMPPATLGVDGRSARPINIPPAQVAQLVQALKSEMALARASENDKVKQQQHFSKAESIRNILVNYQAQQKARMLQQQQQQHQQQNQAQSQQQPIPQYQTPNQQPLNPPMYNQDISPMMQSAQAPSISPMPHQQPLHHSPPNNVSKGNTPMLNSAQMQIHNQNIHSPSLGSPQMNSMMTTSRMGTPNMPNRPMPAPVPAQTVPSTTTTERFNQLKQLLVEIQRKIQILEQRKTTSTLPEAAAAIDKEIMDWKLKFSQFQRVGLIMRSELIEQAKLNQANNAPAASRQYNASSPYPQASTIPNQPDNRVSQAQQSIQGASQGQRELSLQSQRQMSQSGLKSQPQVPQQIQPPLQNQGFPVNQPPGAQRGQVPGPRPGPVPGAGVNGVPISSVGNTSVPQSVPQFNTRTNTPATQVPPNVTGPRPESGPTSRSQEPPPINLQGITKPSVLPMPIAPTISVKPPVAVTFDTDVDGRPSITGGSLLSLGGWINTPAITKMPVFGLTESISSASASSRATATVESRIFSKRKLSDLVNSLGVDEGDGRTGIDGNVEDLLLDLLDEFLQSVTGFACRLAKHRKLNTIEARDIQLHLERNWNIRIPGYAMDEIRLTRKINPTSSYAQKIAGLEIAKSVNEHS